MQSRLVECQRSIAQTKRLHLERKKPIACTIFLSEDQKHSSAVAKVHYQKQRSREVALKGHECLQKLQGTKGSEVDDDDDVHARLGGSTSSVLAPVETTESKNERDCPPTNKLRVQRNSRRVLKFTADEDNFLKEGIDRHGFGQWTAILRDPDFKFQDRRTSDSLKKRAGLKFSYENFIKTFHKSSQCHFFAFCYFGNCNL